MNPGNRDYRRFNNRRIGKGVLVSLSIHKDIPFSMKPKCSEFKKQVNPNLGRLGVAPFKITRGLGTKEKVKDNAKNHPMHDEFRW
jgi:hypothetical protein